MRKRKLPVLVLFFLFAVSLVSGAEDCSVAIDVSEEGVTENTVGFSISPRSGYYYPEGGEWTLGIPVQAEDVDVRDGDGDPLDTTVSRSSDLFKAVSFENDERVSGGETYRFEISYEMPRGVILFDGSGYMEQYLPISFCNNEKSVTVNYPRAWDIRNSSLEGVRRPGSISSQSTYQDTLRLIFDGKYDYAPVKNYSQGIFNVSVPSRYSDYVLSKIEELDSFNNDIKQLTGIETPEGFHITYLPFDSSKISSEASGQYYGGKIEIKSTQLSESDLQHMETLTHELVHGYNDRLSSNSPDWWWEEGTAEYISHKVLEQNGYNVSRLRPSERTVNYTFENCDFQRSFISDWSPVDQAEIVEIDLFPCSDGAPTLTPATGSEEEEERPEVEPITDRDLLGYEYSELMVEQMFEDSPEDVSDVYRLMLERNATFSSSRGLMNNQINYFASKALDRDMTQFLREKGISTESWGYEEEQLADAEQRLEDINGSYPRFQVFDIYFQELEDIRSNFYAGRFEEVEEVSEVVENAERRNITLFQTLQKVESTRSYVRSLEERKRPDFFSSQLRKVNRTLDLVRGAEFDRAQVRLSEIKKSAEDRKARIKEAEERIRELEGKIERTNVFVKPFLMEAGQSLENAERSLGEGRLKESERSISEAQDKIGSSKIFSLVFYFFLVAGSYYLFRVLL